MKKLLLLMAGMAASGAIAQNYTEIPDTNLRNALYEISPSSFNEKKEIDLSGTFIMDEDSLDVSNKNIDDISFLNFFSDLVYLNASGNNLKVVPMLPPSLRHINVEFNNLELIETLPVKLQVFDCSDNANLSPDEYVFPAKLLTLDISATGLKSLPALPSHLERLIASQNEISVVTGLPLSLKKVYLSDNQIKSIGGLPEKIEYLNLSSNPLTALDETPDSLRELYLNNVKLEVLPELPSRLWLLSVNGTATLDTLAAMTDSLKTLDISGTLIRNLPAFNKALQVLYARRSALSEIASLPESLRSIDLSYTSVDELPEIPDMVDYVEISNSEISSLVNLPVNLKALFIDNLHDLKCLPELPEGLLILSAASSGIQCLPNIPDLMLPSSITKVCSKDFNPDGCSLVLGNRAEFISANLKVSPNPASEFINVELDDNALYNVSLVNLNGLEVAGSDNVNLSASFNLNVGSISSGIYVLKVEQGEIIKNVKVVIE